MTNNAINAALLAFISNSAADTDIQITESLQLNRDTYYALYRVKFNDGKIEKYFRSTGIKKNKGTQREAKAKMAEMRSKLIEELVKDGKYLPNSNIDSFASYLGEYIESCKGVIAPTTRDGYNHMYYKYIKPYFEALNISVGALKPSHLTDYYKYLIEKCGLSPNTVEKHHQLIHVCLNAACDNDIIWRNPDDKAKRPKCIEYVGTPYESDELKKLFDVSKGTVLEIPIYLAVYFGLRRSEVLGVRWSDIDFTNGKISICNTVTRQKVDDKYKAVASDKMKSKTSRRVYYFLGEEGKQHLDRLKRIKEKQDEYCRLSDKYKDFVCVNELGELLKPDYITSAFSKLLKENGLKHIRFHDLRHSCLTLLCRDSSIPLKDIQHFAGHASIETTSKIYMHVRQTQNGESLSAITRNIGYDL